jgi:hypothetical protein
MTTPKMKRKPMARVRSSREGKPMRKDVQRNREARAKWDWRLQDVELADIHGLTRERIRQIRRDVHGQRADHYHQERNPTLERLRAACPADVPVRIDIVANALGISHEYARELMHRAGIPIVDLRCRYPWSEVDWSRPNRVIAETLGCKAITVANRRSRKHLGKASACA